jgi:diamine N-acetyltransferase
VPFTNTNPAITCREFSPDDLDMLVHYLHHLSHETKSRFGPHAFDIQGLINFYTSNNTIHGFIAEDISCKEIIGYAVIKKGMLEHDRSRLMQYGYPELDSRCCTFAPSVTDKWQGKGVGKILFQYVVDYCRELQLDKIILWGGVQSTNGRAVNFYKLSGFVTLGTFEYYGSNLDMVLAIS